MKDYGSRFAANLRAKRISAGLTQRRIAEATGYSEKTVSKWERSGCVPEIGALYDLAELLHTSVDGLFRDGGGQYLVGIDGGGTKTELALADFDGNITRTLRADCCNPMDIGVEAAKNTLRSAIYELCGGLLLSDVSMFAGIAGSSSADVRAALTEFFGGFGFRSFATGSDNNNIIAAGLGERDGITIILGTGICAYSQKDGVHKRAAGWGYLVDGGGCAYNIGRDALEAYFAAVDRAGPESAVTRAVAELNPDPPQEFLGKIYAGGKKLIASFAPVVYDALASGDDAAAGILSRNMAYAANIVETAALPFCGHEVIPVVAAGGLTARRETLDYLRAALRNPERFEISVLDAAPVTGAVALARQTVSGQVAPL